MRTGENGKLFGDGCRQRQEFVFHLPKNGKHFLASPAQVERGVEKVGQIYEKRILVGKTYAKNGTLSRAGLQEVIEYRQLLAKGLMDLFYLCFSPV